jgi:putative DNA primase/helicase
MPDLAARGAEAGTDVGRARLVRDRLYAKGFDLAFSPAIGLYLFDPAEGIWESGADHKVRREFHALGSDLRQAAVAVFAEAAAEADEEKRKTIQERANRLFGLATRSERTGAIECGMTELRSLVSRVGPGDFDASSDYIVTTNGTLNLETGALTETNRFDLVTQRIELDFDPDATAPRWEAFLREVLVQEDGITPDEDLIDYVQRIVGYGITGHTSEQMLTVLHGSGANGKSLFVDVLSETFSAITRTAAFETFGVSRRDGGAASPDLARLAGARLVFASEGDEGLALAEGLVKRLTGQELIAARYLNLGIFEFRPRFLLCLVSNHLPQVRGQDEGVWRRIKVIPFRRYFAPHERDRDLRETLLAEREGILAWAVRGAQAWYAAGKDLGEPDAVRRVTGAYRASSDRVRDFLVDSVVVTGEPSDSMTGKELRGLYVDWCREQGEKPFGRNTFFEKVVASDRRLSRDDGAERKTATRILGLRLPTLAEERGYDRGQARLAALPGAVTAEGASV